MPISTLLATSLLLPHQEVAKDQQQKTTFPLISSKHEGYSDTSIVYVQLPEDSEVRKAANLQSRKLATSVYIEFTKNAIEFAQSEQKPVAPWTTELRPTVSLNRPDLVSILYSQYDYSGGAHPNRFYPVINIGLIDGKPKQLTLRDILKPEVRLDDFVQSQVLPRLNAIKEKRGIEPIENLAPGLADHFVLTPAGITWVFEPYAVGAYVEGEYTIKILWSDFKEPFPFIQMVKS